MRLNNFIIFLFGALILSFCSKCRIAEEPEVLNYNNILIYSDLSSRMDKHPNDSMVIDQIIGYFHDDCVKPGIKVNDRSSINFSRVNFYNSNCPINNIDINDFKSLDKKQTFVNNH